MSLSVVSSVFGLNGMLCAVFIWYASGGGVDSGGGILPVSGGLAMCTSSATPSWRPGSSTNVCQHKYVPMS